MTRVGKKPIDQTDPAAMRLVELFKSPEGKRALWRAVAEEAIILYALALIFAFVYHRSLVWGLDPESVGVLIGFGGLISLSWINLEYVGWGMRTWIQREASRDTREVGAAQVRSQYRTP